MSKYISDENIKILTLWALKPKKGFIDLVPVHIISK